MRSAHLTRGWLPTLREASAASLRLYCFHHAGGSPSMYRDWSSRLSRDVEVVPVLLPGRGLRLREEPYTSMAPLVDDVLAAITPTLDRPFALFGHSMGALVAFEIAHALRRTGAIEPSHVFVSACAPPHRHAAVDRRRHDLDERRLIDLVRHLNEGGDSILDDTGIIRRRLPLLRADLAVCETYEWDERAPLDCPLTVYGAVNDPIVPVPELDEWRAYTAASFLRRIFAGGHFYLMERARDPMMRLLGRELDVLLDRVAELERSAAGASAGCAGSSARARSTI
jgi:surfactin synthase thioesterase subunit